MKTWRPPLGETSEITWPPATSFCIAVTARHVTLRDPGAYPRRLTGAAQHREMKAWRAGQSRGRKLPVMLWGDDRPPANVWSPDPEDLKGSVYVMERRDGKPSGWRLEKRPHRPEERRQGVIMRTLLKFRG